MKNIRKSITVAVIIAALLAVVGNGGSRVLADTTAAENICNTDKTTLNGEYIIPINRVEDIASCVSDTRLEASLTHITKDIGSRRVGTSGNAATREWLLSSLRVNGYFEEAGTLYTQGFYSTGEYTENIIAIRPADRENAPIVVLSAHYDTVYGVEGVIDNGSGVALVLEVMQAVRNYGITRDAEIRFIFFSGEEQGCIGAYAYVNSLSAAEKARHAAVFNVDMAIASTSDVPKALTFSTKGGHIGTEYVYGSYASPVDNVVSSAANKAFGINSEGVKNFYAPINWGSTDLVPFHYADIDAATLSWREIAPNRAVTNYDIAKPAYIHTSMDRLENTDISSILAATRVAARTLEVLTNTVTE